MANTFLVNPTDGTINLHYDGLNPADVLELIERLKINLKLMALRPTDPIEILQQSSRLDRAKGILSFCLDWNAPKMEIDLSEDVVIPGPNILLTDEQNEKYLQIVRQMLEAI